MFTVAVGGRLLRWRHDRRAARLATPAADFPIDVTITEPVLGRYGLFEFTVRLTDPAGHSLQVNASPQIIVRDSKMDIVTTVGNVAGLTARYDRARQRYVCYWPAPWNARPGRYLVEAHVDIPDASIWRWELPDPKQKAQHDRQAQPKATGRAICVVEQPFQIVGRTPPQLPPGTCAVTWEDDFPTGPVERPDGTKGDWRAMLDWAQYMGADALWYRAGVTAAYAAPRLTMDQPWAQQNVQPLSRLGDEAHRRGLKFGAWVAAFETFPRTNTYKPPYKFAQDYSPRSGKLLDTHFVSPYDTNRIAQLAAFFHMLQQMPQVDYMGLDYMRVEHAYEMMDAFTSMMPVRLPRQWAAYSRLQRVKYMDNKLRNEWNQDRGKDFYECWNWWRAHVNSQIIAQILSGSKADKPVWVFMLSWMFGHQHGQDPVMFNDAGVSVVAPMLYQCRDFGQFDMIIEDWHNYLRPGNVSLMPGDQVDDYWHKQGGVGRGAIRSRNPAAPEVMYDRMVRGNSQMVAHWPGVGVFWHDISRAERIGASPPPYGNLGPYPGREWALAGGAAFSAVRAIWEVYPLRAELTVPANAPIGSIVQVQLKLQNVIGRAVRDIHVSLEPTPQIEPAAEREKVVPSLGGGETLVTPVQVRITAASPARANRFMVACRLTWPRAAYGGSTRDDLPRVIIAMKYLNGR